MQILVTLSFGIICLSLVFKEKQNKAITVILNGITKLEVLIGDILDVYKLDIGKLKLKKIDANVEKLVNQIVTEFRPLSDEHKVELNSDMQT
jgi:signal transduction histidine kinase